MKIYRFCALVLCGLLTVLFYHQTSFALSLNPQISLDSEIPYSRAFFKHWIDEDKDGCDTRREVLIAEALVKPRVGKKCALVGGV